MSNDQELSGPRIRERLQKVMPHGGGLISFRRGGILFYVVVACCDRDDELTHHANDVAKPAKRELWQRDNVILAVSREINEAVWQAEREALAHQNLTLWFERSTSRYSIGPRTQRSGASGRPDWAVRPAAGDPFHGITGR
jgi:hypothetical protein